MQINGAIKGKAKVKDGGNKGNKVKVDGEIKVTDKTLNGKLIHGLTLM
jgi:hypothetical protein